MEVCWLQFSNYRDLIFKLNIVKGKKKFSDFRCNEKKTFEIKL